VSLVLGCGVAPSRHPGPIINPPLHVLVLADVSRSIEGRVPRPTPSELEPLLDYAEAHGGVVAFCVIGCHVRPSVRAVFRRPRAGAEQPRVNIFLRKPNNPGDFEARRQEYRVRSLEERERFLAAVTELLEETADCTNVVSSLQRSSVFFEESAPDAAQVLLIASDMQDTTGIEYELDLDLTVRLLVVTHSRDLGLLANQADRVGLFENFSAAVHAAVPEEP